MSIAEPGVPRVRTSTLSAFGIGVETSLALPMGDALSGRPITTLRLEHPGELERAWRRREAQTVLERRRRDGRLVMSVDHHPGKGYLVYAPRNGRHLVSADGSRIISAVPRVAAWRWQRLLFAQVLPLAATLQGLELLHASAVSWDESAVGLVAPAGTGKTSVAAHLVAAGRGLVTDDVLALELHGDGVVAYPGVRTISIAEDELDRMATSGRSRLGYRVGRVDKVVLAADVIDHPTTLASLYFLERPSPTRFGIEAIAPDPMRLLVNSFNVYVRTRERIANQLALAAKLVSTVRMFSVRIPAGTSAAEVARAIGDHEGSA